MEEERKAREKEEQDKADRMKKIKDQFADPNSQWEKDKTDIQNEALREKKEKEKAEASNPTEKTQSPAEPKAETKAEAKLDSKVESKPDTVKAQ
jgi:mannan polymerase II complex ANP1 subunit